MPLSTYITTENVRFNGTLDNAVVLDTTSNVRSLILTDGLSQAERDTLQKFLDIHLNGTPGNLSAPTAGYASIDYGSKVGSDATGLSNAAATAGKMAVSFKTAVTGSTTTGLNSATGTAGYQAVDFSTAKAGGDATGLSTGTAATAGRQDLTKTGVVGSTPTGFANDSTVYTVSILIDGVSRAVSIVGSAAQTYTTLVSEINADLGANGTASLVTNALRITSSTTGASSTVAIPTGAFVTALTGTTLAGAVAGAAAIPVTYTATVTVAGVPKVISVVGSAAQTFTTLLSELNADLGSVATATLNGGDIRITASRADEFGTIRISPGTLFPALTGYVGVLAPVAGVGLTRTYSAIITVDGVAKPVSMTGTQANTLANVASQITSQLGSAGSAAVTGNQLVITSSTTGVASSVSVWDGGYLFSSLAGYNGVALTSGTTPPVYTASIVIDGVAKPISLAGSAAQTFTTLVSAVTTAVGAAGTVTFTGGKLKVVSATTGVASTVSVQDGNLFKSVAAFNGVTHYRGIANLLTAFTTGKTGSSRFVDLYRIIQVGLTPTLPATPVKASLPKKPPYIYYGGSSPDWRFMQDDSAM